MLMASPWDSSWRVVGVGRHMLLFLELERSALVFLLQILHVPRT